MTFCHWIETYCRNPPKAFSIFKRKKTYWMCATNDASAPILMCA